MNAANAYFFIQETAWVCCMLAYIREEDKEILHKVMNYDGANKLLPAIVLIVSIVLFRCEFNSKQS